ncbi:hypothetical protein HU200_003803 [Digitaria exilis]|uniref:OCEL domain-containing protein n=1 Tax=Digitaria exilis TaxID=1010633 RepID=A0A835FVW9_9POAL|nr:hypothetical protein HU200_003803 [Digitaria exilis]
MYKLGGRGGGRGGGSGASKRPPAPHGRGRGGSSSIGGMGAPPRGRAAAAAAQPAGRDESFRLESSGPPAFAAIIRLTPDLVDEIRRAEEAGGGARIKFNPNIPHKNCGDWWEMSSFPKVKYALTKFKVIDVNGKEFKFTWASERGELCDIYEERQSGEDGNGLLLECGSAWRKVNVQRILDESAKNLVKMRSEEAERLSKSRKSIVLDPANPSVKSQAKSMAAAAVEAAAIAPTKSVSKVKLSNNIPKGNFSTSPAPSPEQPGANIPSFPVVSDANNEVITPFDLNKEENSKTEKATPNKMSKGINRRASAHSASVDDNTNEVRSLLISVLSENPKGMSLKALEKAVADVLPNASKKIESSIKNIANYQAPGRYVLKPELEVENSKRHVEVSDDLNLSTSPRDLTRLDVDDEQIDIGTNMDYRTASPHIDLNNFNTDNDDAEAEGFAAGNLKKSSEIPGSKNTPSTRIDPTRVDSKYNEMSYQADLFDDSLKTISDNLPNEEAGQLTKQHSNRRKSTSKDGPNHGPMSMADKSAKPKLKRSSGNENSTTKPESAKKIKVDVASPGITGSLSEHKKGLPPEKHSNDRLNKESGSVSRNVSRDSSPAMKGRPLSSGNIQKIDQSPNVPIPTMHSERPKENIEKSSLKKKAEKMQKPWHGTDGDFGIGYSHGEGHHANLDGSDDSSARKKSRYGDPLVDDKVLKRSKDANANINSMNLTKSSSGNAGLDEITAFPGLNESNGELSTSQRVNVERSPHGKKKLQRELSDLELGEFRETSLENDNERTRKQFERNSSSKSLDAKLASIDNSYPGMNNRKAHVSGFHDRGKPSPQEYGVGGQRNQEAFPRKAAGYDFDDNRPQQRGNIPENQHFPRTDASDSENISYRPGEKTSKKDPRMAQGGVLEHADVKKKTTSRLPQNGYNNATVTRTQKSISPSDNEERSRNNSFIESETGRKRDSSSDDDNLFFSKYDKDEPELKAPIKDFSQYKDYVQEYNEKYGVYTYLNSQIEKTKYVFCSSFALHRHKLMKKVFVLLHEELQTMKQRITDFTEAYSNE